MKTINVIIYGFGVMGQGAARALLEKKSLKIVGAVDIDPELVGKDLADILETPQKSGITIKKDADALFSGIDAQAVVLTTTSHLKSVFLQIVQCVKAGLNVISTCEELSFPWKRSPELAKQIDALAKEKGVTVVGTGINPGYLMDILPLVLTAPCLRVDSIKVTRMMNSAKRRLPFQKKIGTGMTKAEFAEKIKNKIITGHVGLLESINMIAAGLGWELDETLEFNANANVDEEYDEIIIEGIPPIKEKIIGGVHGDIGTVAVTVNTISRAVEAPAGLKVMKDLPLAAAVL